MTLRAIIADDEPLARERVRSFLAEEADIKIVAECKDGAETLKAVEKESPDLLFLDVQMPRLNGFEVLEALDPEAIPLVIFTTAHDEHAIRAFEVNALDYLLKPCTEERFRKAMVRARKQLQQRAERTSNPQISALLSQLRSETGGSRRILVKSPDRILFLKPDEIDHIEAAGNYVVLHSGKERHIVRETMAAMESRLHNAGFMRVSRAAIVNLSRVKEVNPITGGHFSLMLKNGVRLDMTCSLKDFRTRLGEV